MCKIDWGHYDGREAKSKFKTLQKYQAAALNGNLGKVYKALHEGNSEKAHTIGHEKVTTVVGKKQTVTSVFERYPELHQKVKQAHHADRAKAERVRIAQEATIKHDAVNAQMHYEKQNGQTLFEKHPDLLKDRCNVTTIQFYDPRFFEKLHTVLAEHAARIDPQHLTADQKGILCAGSHLQHYLVDEAISVVDTAISGDLVENMQDAVITLANTSLTLNKEGDVIMASRTLDACWALVDHAHAAARCAYSIIVTHAPFIAKGMADGVCESLHGAAHVVCHPVQAAQEAVKSLAVAGYYLGKVAYSVCAFDAACELWEADPEHFEQKIREHLIDPEAFVAIYEHAKNNISTEDVARVGTKTAVDMMLLHGATKVVSAIAKESWPALISCMRKGEQSAEVALTAENIPVQCGEEIAALMENMENAVKTETIAETITNSRKLVENIVGSFMAELNTEIESLKKVFDCAQSCVPDCVKKGFAEFKNKHIKIPYEHIFGIELKWNDIKNSLSGISGFHHDFMGAIEKSGVLKFMRKGVEKNGCYLADVIVDGSRIRDKTFFPQSWSREKVVNKIYEAYENFIKNGAIVKEERGGKYLINGFTSEGIEVEMYITKKGQIATAYPVVKAGI